MAKFESKYDIGQRLWKIVEERVGHEHCPTCKQSVRSIYEYKPVERKIISFYVDEDGIEYELQAEGSTTFYTYDYSTEAEDEITEKYYLTQAEAQAECDRRNNENK